MGSEGAVDAPVAPNVSQLFEDDVDDGAGQEGGGRLRDGVVPQAALDQAVGEGGRPAQLGEVLEVDGVLEEEGNGGRKQPELELGPDSIDKVYLSFSSKNDLRFLFYSVTCVSNSFFTTFFHVKPEHKPFFKLKLGLNFFF